MVKRNAWVGFVASAVFFFAGFAAYPVAAQSYAAVDERQVDEYLQTFLEMALLSDGGLGRPARVRRIVKRTMPVQAVFLGTTLDLGIPALRQLAALAGLEVKILPARDGSENLVVDYLSEPGSGGHSCFAFSQGVEPRTRVLIDPARERVCVMHEFMHAFGLSHAHARDTIMSYIYSTGELTDVDKLMISVMYDSRLKPGTRWLPAMATARTILVDRLVERGAPPGTKAMGHLFVKGMLPLLLNYAEKGDVEAQTQLGFAYTFDDAPGVVAKDFAAGYLWFWRAAEKGQPEAEANVGVGLLRGRGVTPNASEGVRWLRSASDRQHAGAQYQLGLAYRDGSGVERDPIEAYKWFAIALRGFPRDSEREMQTLSRTLTFDQVSEAKRRAAVWQPAAREVQSPTP